MNWLQGSIAVVVTTVVTTAVVGLCFRTERASPDFRGDAATLEYSRAMRWFMRCAGMAFLALWSWTLFRAFADDATDKDAGLAGMATFACLPLVIGAWREPLVRLEMDAAGIRGRTAFRGYRSIAWSDVVLVQYSVRSATWQLRDRHGEKLRIPRYLVGSGVLVTALEAKVSENVWKTAVDAWRAHRG